MPVDVFMLYLKNLSSFHNLSVYYSQNKCYLILSDSDLIFTQHRVKKYQLLLIFKDLDQIV